MVQSLQLQSQQSGGGSFTLSSWKTLPIVLFSFASNARVLDNVLSVRFMEQYTSTHCSTVHRYVAQCEPLHCGLAASRCIPIGKGKLKMNFK